jgi:hypothetical protein
MIGEPWHYVEMFGRASLDPRRAPWTFPTLHGKRRRESTTCPGSPTPETNVNWAPRLTRPLEVNHPLLSVDGVSWIERLQVIQYGRNGCAVSRVAASHHHLLETMKLGQGAVNRYQPRTHPITMRPLCYLAAR